MPPLVGCQCSLSRHTEMESDTAISAKLGIDTFPFLGIDVGLPTILPVFVGLVASKRFCIPDAFHILASLYLYIGS